MQNIIQDAIDNADFNGVQESIQLAGTSGDNVFVFQNAGPISGMDDLDLRYTAVIDQNNLVYMDSSVPVDIEAILDDLKSRYYKSEIVSCNIAFPEINMEDSDDSINPLREDEVPNEMSNPNIYNYIIILIEGQWDYGDVPDHQYHTLLAANGARHFIVPGFYLGQRIDADDDGRPGANATGDNINGTDDEDGAVFVSPLIAGSIALINVTASHPGILNAWMDFNGDGDWEDMGEKIISDRELNAGECSIGFDLPATAMQGFAYVRFRFSSIKGLSFDGPAPDGEVEDYIVHISSTAKQK